MVFALVLAVVSASCGSAEPDARGQAAVRIVEVATGLEHPWGMAFLPDGRVLVTERPGRLLLIDLASGRRETVPGTPLVHVDGQAGLLDVALDPDYAKTNYVYLSFVDEREGGNATAVARGRLVDGNLNELQWIFRQEPAMPGKHHYGSRLVFDRGGRLFVTLGERMTERAQAQTLDTHLGKVVRIERDGSIPADNPFVDTPGARPEIWSYGHRNLQGAALHPVTGELWTNEHGPKGGDELNRTLAGRNYGWPAITYGLEYSGGKVSEFTEKPGMEQPAHYWVPSIGISGLAFYTSDRIAGWKGSVFVGGLSGKQLVRVMLDGERVTGAEVVLGDAIKERVRDVRQGPDGLLYLLTDEKAGRLLRIEPVP